MPVVDVFPLDDRPPHQRTVRTSYERKNGVKLELAWKVVDLWLLSSRSHHRREARPRSRWHRQKDASASLHGRQIDVFLVHPPRGGRDGFIFTPGDDRRLSRHTKRIVIIPPFVIRISPGRREVDENSNIRAGEAAMVLRSHRY